MKDNKTLVTNKQEKPPVVTNKGAGTVNYQVTIKFKVNPSEYGVSVPNPMDLSPIRDLVKAMIQEQADWPWELLERNKVSIEVEQTDV